MADHPMQPPQELIAHAIAEARNATPDCIPDRGGVVCEHVARAMYAAGADAQLEACVEWGNQYRNGLGRQLRDAMRPKPPRDKELALQALEEIDEYAVFNLQAYEIYHQLKTGVAKIRKVLEMLPDD